MHLAARLRVLLESEGKKREDPKDVQGAATNLVRSRPPEIVQAYT
ncbi:MAG: hypothetical protein AAFZ18_10500 [Myxococcota bacterium]